MPRRPPSQEERQRRQHTRSRRGCQVCKTKHIRCDELRPTCTYCYRRGLQCAYVDAPEIQERKASKGSEVAACLLNLLPKHGFVGYSVELPYNSRMVFDFFNHLTTKTSDESQTGGAYAVHRALRDPAMLHAALLLSCVQWMWYGHVNREIKEAYIHHKLEAMRFVKEHLADPNYLGNPSMMACISNLAVAESAVGCEGVAKTHLNGLARIISCEQPTIGKADFFLFQDKAIHRFLREDRVQTLLALCHAFVDNEDPLLEEKLMGDLVGFSYGSMELHQISQTTISVATESVTTYAAQLPSPVSSPPTASSSTSGNSPESKQDPNTYTLPHRDTKSLHHPFSAEADMHQNNTAHVTFSLEDQDYSPLSGGLPSDVDVLSRVGSTWCYLYLWSILQHGHLDLWIGSFMLETILKDLEGAERDVLTRFAFSTPSYSSSSRGSTTGSDSGADPGFSNSSSSSSSSASTSSPKHNGNNNNDNHQSSSPPDPSSSTAGAGNNSNGARRNVGVSLEMAKAWMTATMGGLCLACAFPLGTEQEKLQVLSWVRRFTAMVSRASRWGARAMIKDWTDPHGAFLTWVWAIEEGDGRKVKVMRFQVGEE